MHARAVPHDCAAAIYLEFMHRTFCGYLSKTETFPVSATPVEAGDSPSTVAPAQLRFYFSLRGALIALNTTRVFDFCSFWLQSDNRMINLPA
jgi:hypothetical protein